MYNRYLSTVDAPYVPTEPSGGEAPPQNRSASGETNSPPPPPGGSGGSPMDRIQQLLGFGGGRKDGGEGTPLRRLLARFHLEDVDTGDLLLLILLFFLLEERADDELLIALGLLLIL